MKKLLFLLLSLSALAQQTQPAPIKVIAKPAKFGGCDKMCSISYEVIKVIESDGYPVQDTIVVEFKNRLSKTLKRKDLNTFYTLTLNRYTDCANATDRYIMLNHDYDQNALQINDTSLIPKKKVVYTVQKPCETNLMWFGTFVMDDKWVDKFITRAEETGITKDIATIRFDIKGNSEINGYHISNKIAIAESQMQANKLAMLIVWASKLSTDASMVLGCNQTQENSINITINFEMINIK